jgi:hypothetical protein
LCIGLINEYMWLGRLGYVNYMTWNVAWAPTSQSGRLGVVFIATIQIVAVGEVCWRWAHRIVRCATGHCPVCHRTVSGVPPRQPPVRSWSWSTVGGSVLMWHRTVRCDIGQSGAPLTVCSDIWFSLFILQSRPLRADSRCSAGTPDSPVAHRTVQWIIAELRLGNPKVKSLKSILPGAPDSPVRQTREHFCFLCSFLLEPFLIFVLVLSWTFGTWRTYILEQTS